ncbi:MAG: sporulation-specific protein 15, partial [Selenomonas sp.]|nr:sporulation-specific protein 15 [Selenomonas sp.]
VLPPMDAAEIMEPEFDYITTIENILTTTAELKRGAVKEKETAEALRSGLIAFYDGLRKEMNA